MRDWYVHAHMNGNGNGILYNVHSSVTMLVRGCLFCVVYDAIGGSTAAKLCTG